jgi:hypothetical protein
MTKSDLPGLYSQKDVEKARTKGQLIGRLCAVQALLWALQTARR